MLNECQLESRKSTLRLAWRLQTELGPNIRVEAMLVVTPTDNIHTYTNIVKHGLWLLCRDQRTRQTINKPQTCKMLKTIKRQINSRNMNSALKLNQKLSLICCQLGGNDIFKSVQSAWKRNRTYIVFNENTQNSIFQQWIKRCQQTLAPTWVTSNKHSEHTDFPFYLPHCENDDRTSLCN